MAEVVNLKQVELKNYLENDYFDDENVTEDGILLFDVLILFKL